MTTSELLIITSMLPACLLIDHRKCKR